MKTTETDKNKTRDCRGTGRKERNTRIRKTDSRESISRAQKRKRLGELSRSDRKRSEDAEDRDGKHRETTQKVPRLETVERVKNISGELKR